jgi:hypothetical protein
MVTPVVVVLTTVPERALAAEETARQWVALGFEPVVVETPPDLPRGPLAHTLTAQQGLRQVLGEDDIDLSPAIPACLPAMVASGEAVTLYLYGWSYYGAATARELRQALATGTPVPFRLERVRNQRHWHGSQAVLLPGDLARALLLADPRGRGLDITLRRVLEERGRPLLAAVPNLVQHRGLPSVCSPRFRPHRSRSFGLAVALP